MVSKIGEVKRSKESFNEEQSLKQLALMFNISKSTGISLIGSTLEENKYEFEIKFKGNVIDNLLLFERSEKI
jgi:hypothetical protein